MRTLLISIVVSLMAFGCSKDREDADPCARAVENARRLVQQDDAARTRYGTEPLTLDRCRELSASSEQVSCLAYASTWSELEACHPSALRTGVAGR